MQKKCNVHVSNLSPIQTRDYGSIVSELYQQCTAIYTLGVGWWGERLREV